MLERSTQIGFKAVVLLTGHYGPNWKDLQTLVAKMQPHVRAELYGLPDFEAAGPGFDVDGKYVLTSDEVLMLDKLPATAVVIGSPVGRKRYQTPTAAMRTAAAMIHHLA